MIGRTLVVAALLLPDLVTARPSDINDYPSYVTFLKDKGYINAGKLELPVAKYCNPSALQSTSTGRLCNFVTEQAKKVHALESALFCSGIKCGAKYDPVTGLCQCGWETAQRMNEDTMWPGKNCIKTKACYAPLEAHWNPAIQSCTCAVETFPLFSSLIIRFEPDAMKDELYGPNPDKMQAPTVDEQRQAVVGDVKHLIPVLRDTMKLVKQVTASYASLTDTLKKMNVQFQARKARSLDGDGDLTMLTGDATLGAVSLAPLPTYIPPPDTEVTQELIQESLLIQPQQIATVGSVIPRFADGIITFLIQLDGPIPQTLALNATDTLSCETIGAQPPPNLMLVPKIVKNGTSETSLPTCLVIAVNMYDPNYITYWVQKEDGSVYSLLSDNKIYAIDQLDTSQPTSVAIRVAPVDNTVKRDMENDVNVVAWKRHQVFSISCDGMCPFSHMDRITSNDGYCGCLFKSASEEFKVSSRGVEQPTPYTATMTAEACAAMTCINNGGQSALFNPFTATCWCASPTFLEESKNAYGGGS